jgi:hypothetical protein
MERTLGPITPRPQLKTHFREKFTGGGGMGWGITLSLFEQRFILLYGTLIFSTHRTNSSKQIFLKKADALF